MKARGPAVIIVGLVVVVVIALITIGAPSSRPTLDQTVTHSPPTGPAIGSDPGLTLVSVSVDLPEDTATFPDGPHADVINANCTACHSASMALYQPPLSAETWYKEVEKMRNTFKAPVAEKDVPDIVAYLTAMSARTAARQAPKTKGTK